MCHSAPLCSAPGEKDKDPRMLLVLGWWSLVLFELSTYRPRSRSQYVVFLFVVPHFGMFWWVTKTLLNFLISYLYVFQQTFKGSVGRPNVDHQEKKIFLPTKPRVINTMIKVFLEIFRISRWSLRSLGHGAACWFHVSHVWRLAWFCWKIRFGWYLRRVFI